MPSNTPAALTIQDLDSQRISVGQLKSDSTLTLHLNKLPSYKNIREGTIVRLRAMVQDNLDRVMKHKSYGEYDLRYRSGLDGIPSSYNADFGCAFYNVDRYSLVSIPGATASTPLPFESVASYYNADQLMTEKRELSSPGTDRSPSKRAREEIMCDDNLNEIPPDMVPVSDEQLTSTAVPAGPIGMSPHPIPNHLIGDKDDACNRRFCCLANVSDGDREFKLHELVDVIGVVYNSPNEPDLPYFDFTIEVIHIEPLVANDEKTTLSPQVSSSSRSHLKSALTDILLGDEVAAEYFLLQLISNRIEGHEALPTMGSWTLSLSNTQDVDLTRLTKFVQSIANEIPHVISAVVSFDASNQVLMSERFYPLRLPDAEFTSPGMLQLAPKTLVIIDERSLGEGNVNAMNVLAINKAVREQILIGVFGDSSCIDFPIDLKFVILNRGRSRSIFEKINPSIGVNGSVPIAHCELRPASPARDVSEIDVPAVAQYIAQSQLSIKDVDISDEVVSKFQTDWVESRKSDPKIPTDDIHVWATLMRVIAASHLCGAVVNDHLDQLLLSENARRSRLPISQDPVQNSDVQAVAGG